jgi:hypothetical protein
VTKSRRRRWLEDNDWQWILAYRDGHNELGLCGRGLCDRVLEKMKAEGLYPETASYARSARGLARLMKEVSDAKGNVNFLQGMRCPKCGALGPFSIRVSGFMVFEDAGAEGDASDLGWDDEAPCACLECGHEAEVSHFTIEDEEDD